MTRHMPPGNLLYQSPLIVVWFGSFGIRATFHTAKRGDISEPVGARPAKFWYTVQNIVSYHWTKCETSQCYKSIRGGNIPHSGSDIPQRGGADWHIFFTVVSRITICTSVTKDFGISLKMARRQVHTTFYTARLTFLLKCPYFLNRKEEGCHSNFVSKFRRFPSHIQKLGYHVVCEVSEIIFWRVVRFFTIEPELDLVGCYTL